MVVLGRYTNIYTTTNLIPPEQGMGEVERRQILPLPQEAPGSRETASKKTSGKCRCVGDKAKHKEQKRHNHKQIAGNHRQANKQKEQRAKGSGYTGKSTPNKQRGRPKDKQTNQRKQHRAGQSNARGLKLRQSKSKKSRQT